VSTNQIALVNVMTPSCIHVVMALLLLSQETVEQGLYTAQVLETVLTHQNTSVSMETYRTEPQVSVALNHFVELVVSTQR
jgi:hypothetical protein